MSWAEAAPAVMATAATPARIEAIFILVSKGLVEAMRVDRTDPSPPILAKVKNFLTLWVK